MNSDGAQEAPTALRIGASFTLIELLVVIAIIALLAALLLPALNRAKIQGRSVACKNHLHQMSLALRMYVDDSRGQYPYSDCGLLMPPPLLQMANRDRGLLFLAVEQRSLSLSRVHGRHLMARRSPGPPDLGRMVWKLCLQLFWGFRRDRA